MIEPKKAALAAALAFFAFATPAAQAADAAEGKKLAIKICSNCHVVGDGNKPKGSADAIPSFPAMANNPKYNENRLRAWLFDPHPPMPNIQLTKTETDDIVAYILSLRK
jgi:cytochrome c